MSYSDSDDDASDDNIHSFDQNGDEEKSDGDENDALSDGEKQDESSEKLDFAHIEHQVSAAIRLRREEKEQKAAAEGIVTQFGDVDEHLGDDFEDTPWVAPTLEVAWEWRLKNLYRGGKTALSEIKLAGVTDMGLGLPLYFIFVRTMAVVTFFMSLLSGPALVFSYFGHRIPKEDRDFLNIYRLTIGNIGHDPDSSDYESASACSGAAHLSCVSVFSVEFSLQAVANIIAICEILQILVFLLGVRYLRRKLGTVRGSLGTRTCHISDYSVKVENIPPDTSLEQLVAHFSSLYALDRKDWKGRPILDEAETVKVVHNSGNLLFKDTWVADATIFSRIGSMVRAFKSKRQLMESLLRYRAQMKMYSDGTCHANGPNPTKFRRAEQKMLHAGVKIDSTTAKAMKKARKHIKPVGQQQSGASTHTQVDGLHADAFVAFVVFNYSESMARCIEDYAKYNSFPRNLFMPRKMMFRGRRIRVTHAPEPDDILWENLEISPFKRGGRRLLTALTALLLIVAGFVIVLQAANYKQKFDDDIPKLYMCESEIPALYQNSYDVKSGVEIVRPDLDKDDFGLQRSDYDTECDSFSRGTFYAVYTEDGNFNKPITNYSIANGCVVGIECPLPGETSYCPCISTDSADTCETLSCSTDDSSSECTQFRSSTVAGCYCYQTLLDIFSGSFLDLVETVNSSDGHCEDFLTNYMLALFLTLAASFCTVVLNFALKAILKILAKKEFHNTTAEEQRAIIVKVFIATYINMAMVALLAYGYVRNKPGLAKTASVMEGDYADTTSSWYAQVGSYLVVTFFLQMCGPLAGAMFKYYILTPCKMCSAHPKISNQAAHNFPMQSDVNSLELGGVFDSTVHNAQLLALLFFAMTYGTGLPVMNILCCLAFTFYFRFDKFLLLRYYQKPPKMGDAVMKIVVSFLPWACVIRLGFACWILSNKKLFPSSRLLIEKVPGGSFVNTEHLSAVYNDWVESQEGRDLYWGINSGTRIPRGHVFPLFVLMVVIIVYVLMKNFFKHSPLFYVGKLFSGLWKCCKSLRKRSASPVVTGLDLIMREDPLRAEMAPFSGDYFQYLTTELEKKKEKMCKCFKCCKIWKKYIRDDLSPDEIESGWRISFKGSDKVKMAQWPEATNILGVTRPKGSMRRTYEVIASHGCTSYNLRSIPFYKPILLAMQEGVSSIAENYDEEKAGGAALSIVDKYNNNHVTKAKQAEEDAQKSQTLWKTKPDSQQSKATNPSAVVPEPSEVAPFGKLQEDLFSDDGGDY